MVSARIMLCGARSLYHASSPTFFTLTPRVSRVRCAGFRVSGWETLRATPYYYCEFVMSPTPSPPSHGALHQSSRSYRFGIRAGSLMQVSDPYPPNPVFIPMA